MLRGGGPLIAALLMLPACWPVHVDYRCNNIEYCSRGVAVNAQDLTVSGADSAHFTTGRGTLWTYPPVGTPLSTVDRRARLLEMGLAVPADRVRYNLTIEISR